MTAARAHVPVLLDEAVTRLVEPRAAAPRPHGLFVDATFGRGGHSRALLAQLSADDSLLALDRDPAAEAEAAAIDDPRFRFRATAFSALGDLLAERPDDALVGVLADLGVSSPQLDDPERGFSFMNDGPLDMRMDPRRGEPVSAWLERVSEAELADVLYYYGEERHARRLARVIVQRMQEAPMTRTAELAELIAAATPRRDPHKHPATRTFQALRIAINDELREVETLLGAAAHGLAVGGRLAVISFHSLEDRQVKLHFRELVAKGGPAGQRYAAIGRMEKPSAAEVARNPRARSACLRTLERIA